MQPRHLVVIGTSAGGIEALRQLVADLPADFPAAIAIVMHTSPQSPGVLHDILERSGRLPAINPGTIERLEGGRIYVAPPDFHLLVEPGRLRLTKGPRENRFRPAIDPLFRSAAQVYGPRAVGVILTGNLDDGAAGLWAIKKLGGIAIVQDPADAMFPSMPTSALANVTPDHVVPLPAIAPLLVRVTEAAPLEDTRPAVPEHVEVEVNIAREEHPIEAGLGRISTPSPFTCPECHGVLMRLEDEGRIRFRCHTGHAYSAESLLAELRESIEAALWTTIRAMQEGDLLMRELASHLETAHGSTEAHELTREAERVARQAGALRDMVTSTPEIVLAKR